MHSKTRTAPKNAIALEYDGENTPTVTAKGTNEIAQKIIEIAKLQGIPIQENPDLVYLLSQVDLGEDIPEMLYTAVAEVLAFAYWLTGKKPWD